MCLFLFFTMCWLLLCLSRPFCIFERCLDSNPESCRSKQARYQLTPPSPCECEFENECICLHAIVFKCPLQRLEPQEMCWHQQNSDFHQPQLMGILAPRSPAERRNTSIDTYLCCKYLYIYFHHWSYGAICILVPKKEFQYLLHCE